MTCETELSARSRAYVAAHAAHYDRRDLPLAVGRYKKLIASYPGTKEAEYSSMQIRNIVNAVIPERELLEAQLNLLLAHFKHDSLLDTVRIPVISDLKA